MFKIDKEEVLYEVNKKGNAVRVTKTTTTDGKTYLDIRKFYTKDGELRPTQKGIMLSVDQWEELYTVLGGILNETEVDTEC